MHHGLQLLAASGRDGEREERQAPRRGEALDRRAVGDGLERHVEGRACVVHGAADQRLHGRGAPARVDQFDVERLGREVAARSGHLVGNHAQQLPAKGQAQLRGGAATGRARVTTARAECQTGGRDQQALAHRSPVADQIDRLPTLCGRVDARDEAIHVGPGGLAAPHDCE